MRRKGKCNVSLGNLQIRRIFVLGSFVLPLGGLALFSWFGAHIKLDSGQNRVEMYNGRGTRVVKYPHTPTIIRQIRKFIV